MHVLDSGARESLQVVEEKSLCELQNCAKG